MSNGEHEKEKKEESIGETEKHGEEGEMHEKHHEEHGEMHGEKRPAPRPGKLLAELVPDEAMKHGREARKEFWLAIRSLVDARIQQIEKEEEPSKERRKIEIE